MSEIVIPSNPEDLKKLHAAVKELTNSMTRQDAEKEYQREAIADLSEQFGIDKKHIRRMAVDAHKDSFDKKVGEMEDYAQLYESVMVTRHNYAVEVEDDEDEG